jgi:RNA polymerase sigma-70 factor (ECF subfamily)
MKRPALALRTDEELLADFRADPKGAVGCAAASELLGRHQRQVYIWCHRVVRDPERALDLAQDVLTKAFGAMSHFEGRSKFSSWLFVIARNRCLSAIAAPSLLRDEAAEPDRIASTTPGPEQEYEQALEESALRNLMMQHLDEQEREALWLRCFEKLAVEDITRILDLQEVSGARALLQRARRKLRAALIRRDEEDS